jgi:hypothetical protein
MEPTEPHVLGVDAAAAAAALAWVEHLRQGDIKGLWPSTSHDYRLALTQWWMTANPNVWDDPAVEGQLRDDAAEEVSTGHRPLFHHLRRVLARDLRNSLSALGDHVLLPGTAARLVSLNVELVALFVADDVPGGTFAPAATARVVSVAVTEEEGGWSVAGLNCVGVPGWPPTWLPVDASLGG